MNLPNEIFCVLPWVSVETSPIGTMRPCCLAEDELTNGQGEKLRIGQDTVEQAQESMRGLRSQFLNGEKPETCKKCWAVEDSGGKSKRQYTLERLSGMINDSKWTTEHKPLAFIDFKLGNICNLKCRICGSWSSSSYATEELQELPTALRKESFPYKMIERGRWPREVDSFWQEMSDNVDNIRYLEFTGGEPFMIKEHFDFLQTLVDKGVAKDIEIHYNTNGTQYPEKDLAVWREFKLVEIAFSIDDVSDRFEYQRKNASWKEVNANIQKFKELKQEFGNIVLQCCSTVNVFNVMYLEKLSYWIDQQDFDFVYWNILHEIWYNSVANLHPFAKLKAQARLSFVHNNNRHYNDFQRIIKFMEQGTGNGTEELLKQVRRFDQLRNESLWDHHPELAEAIGYERT